jgi:large subunit ribosomal protein L3
MARKGILGTKLGMTQVFDENNRIVPVTVVKAGPNVVTRIRTPETDGYSAVQVAYGEVSPRKVNKPVTGQYTAAGVNPRRHLAELRLDNSDAAGEYEVGQELTAEIFADGAYVDVTGTSKGKGFAGTMKRHNFAGGMKTHGNSLSHRAPGSIGQRQTPGRVFKGKRMSGHMGVRNRTIENLRIVEVDAGRNLLLISGAVPGAEGGRVIVRPSLKAASQSRRKRLMPNKAPVAAKGAPAAKGAVKAEKK